MTPHFMQFNIKFETLLRTKRWRTLALPIGKIRGWPTSLRSLLAFLKIKKSDICRILKLWCEQRGSNPRPQPWQGCAAGQLRYALLACSKKTVPSNNRTVSEYLVRAKGLEPSTSTLARLRSSQLSYARTAGIILTYIFTYCKYYFCFIFPTP